MSLFGLVWRQRHLQYAVTDALVYLLAIEAGHALARLWGHAPLHVHSVLIRSSGASLFLVSSTILMLYLADGYQRTIDYRRPAQHLRLWAAVAGGQVVSLVIYRLFPLGWWGIGVSLATGLSLGVLLSASRFLICWFRPPPVFPTRTLVVGTGRAAQLIDTLLRADRQDAALFQVVGFVEPPNGHPRRRRDDGIDDVIPEGESPLAPLLGGAADLPRLCVEHRVDLIVVAIRGSLSGALLRILLECKTRGAAVEELPTFYKRLTGTVPVHFVSDSWLVFGPVFSRRNRLATGARRIADVAFALTLGLAVAPVVALAALAIRLDGPGSPFYVQERLGRDERPFGLVKLRTMVQDAEAETGAVWSSGAADPRVTRVGRFLRRTRIDELPQLINVLRGEMSLVGPRPEREHFVRRLKEKIPFYALRFAVKPGITGWAQVNFRYGNTDEDAVEKLRYELYEIQELSAPMYLFILLKTVQTVLMRPGS